MVHDVPCSEAAATRLNERGNEIRRAFCVGRDIFHYENVRCRASDGWHRFPTPQDALWHAVFVNPEDKEVVSFCEGAETRVICHTHPGYRAELRHLVERYGVLLPPALAPKSLRAETPNCRKTPMTYAGSARAG